MPRFEYRDADHAYLLDGRRIPSVTQVLTLTGRIDDRWFTEAACERGRQVHAVCEVLDLGKPPDMLQAERAGIASYVDAYRMFLRDCRPVYDSIERGLYHKTLRYGGRPDRGCRRLFGTSATLELKSGAEEDWHGVQLAGYERLRPKGARWVCYLQKNGRYKIRQCENVDDHQEFLRALRDVWASWPAPQVGVAV